MGSSFCIKKIPPQRKAPPLYEEGTIANGTMGEKKTSPVSFADSPLLIEGAFVRCA